jgi:hypothetical protein
VSSPETDPESAPTDNETADLTDDEQQSHPYVFAATDIEDSAQVFDAAFVDAVDGWEGWGAIETAVKDLQPALAEPCLRALKQAAARDLELVRGDAAGAEFVSDRVLLPAVADVPADEVLLWEAMAERATAPAALARLNDLLFLRRAGNPGARAKSAVRGYLDSIAGRDDGFTTTIYLLRAWTLCRRVNAAAIENTVLDDIERRVDVLEAAGAGQSMPGVMYPLLRTLCEKPLDATRVSGVRTHAAAVLDRLAANAHRGDLASRLATMRRKVAGPAASLETLEAIRSDELDGYMRYAEQSPNEMVRLLRLEEAARTATQRGLPDRAKEIVVQMQAIRPEDLGMETFTTSVPIPKWIPETYLARFTKGPTWQDGLARFLLAPEPPSGRVVDLRAFAHEGRGSVRRVFVSALLGPDALPRAALYSEDEKDLEDMALAGRTHAEWNGMLLAEGLDRIERRYDRPTVDQLTSFITDFGAVDVPLARSLAKGFDYFWNGDYEAATCVVTPKIEAAARALLRKLDEGIYQVQVGKSKGGYPGLYGLLTELENLALDEDWAWFLHWLLLGPIGANVRNDVAHGFRADLGRTYTALVLRAAAILITAAPEIQGTQRAVVLAPEREADHGGRARVLDAILRRVSTIGIGTYTLAESTRVRLRRQGSRD